MSVQAPSEPDLRQQVHDAARRARVAARELATLSTAAKNSALHAAADNVLRDACTRARGQQGGSGRRQGRRHTRRDAGPAGAQPAADRRHRRRTAAGGRAARPDRRGAARADAAQRPAAAPAAGSARRDRNGLRRQAERDRRRVRPDAQGGQCGASARQLVGGAVEPGAGHRVARRAADREPQRRRRAACCPARTGPASPI